jgi:ABC-type multidrug transport system ATPase subunit
VSGDPAIATAGLTKDYGSGHGLFGLDLEVARGEVFGFLGPNGAGKSTTMRLLLDLIKPTSGSARILGLDTTAESLEIRRRVGFLPGDSALYPKLTGEPSSTTSRGCEAVSTRASATPSRSDSMPISIARCASFRRGIGRSSV